MDWLNTIHFTSVSLKDISDYNLDNTGQFAYLITYYILVITASELDVSGLSHPPAKLSST